MKRRKRKERNVEGSNGPLGGTRFLMVLIIEERKKGAMGERREFVFRAGGGNDGLGEHRITRIKQKERLA